MADAFTAKPFLTIVGDMIAYARAVNRDITDYNVGSVARTLLEAPAIEIDALYQAYIAGLLDGIPTAIYQGFGFTALGATAASGYVTFITPEVPPEPITVPAGTMIRDPLGIVTYETQTSASITSLTATVAIAATTAGSAGNAIAGALTTYSPAIPGVTVTNAEPVLGGRETETAEERRIRFARYIKTLARGTVASLEYAAYLGETLSTGGLTMERVRHVTIEETTGRVNLYIHNGTGNTSAALVARVTAIVDGTWDAANDRWTPGYRPAGMRVDVHAMQEQPVNVAIEITAEAGLRTSTFISVLEAAIGDAIREGQRDGLLRPIEIVNGVLHVAGVDGAILLSPTVAPTIPANTFLVPGTIAITWA